MCSRVASLSFAAAFVALAPACPAGEGEGEGEGDGEGEACVPEMNAEAQDLPRTSCVDNAVTDSCGNTVQQCGEAVCFVHTVWAREAGVAHASCGYEGAIGDRCPSEESDYPPCATGLLCVETEENDVSVCVEPTVPCTTANDCVLGLIEGLTVCNTDADCAPAPPVDPGACNTAVPRTRACVPNGASSVCAFALDATVCNTVFGCSPAYADYEIVAVTRTSTSGASVSVCAYALPCVNDACTEAVE